MLTLLIALAPLLACAAEPEVTTSEHDDTEGTLVTGELALSVCAQTHELLYNGAKMREECSMPKRKRRVFTLEFKAEAVRLCQAGDRTVRQVAKDLDLTETALREWVKRADIDAGTGPAGALTTAERDELTRLRRENQRLQMEREILKKAAAFFAKETSIRCLSPVFRIAEEGAMLAADDTEASRVGEAGGGVARESAIGASVRHGARRDGYWPLLLGQSALRGRG